MKLPTICAAVLCGVLAGCAVPLRGTAVGEPETLHAAPDGAVLEHAALARRIDAADVIYLGEKHGNRFHHAAQLRVIRELVARGKRPAIAFEVVTLPETSELVSFVQSPAGAAEPAARLRHALGWSGDDYRWRDYGPLFEFARANQLPVAGIDLPRSLRRRISRVGLEGLVAPERSQLHDSGFVDAEYEEIMHERLNTAHCGFAPPTLRARLYATWVARNDAMAAAITALAAEQPGQPVVVIVGSEHAANNMGVYERVAHRAPALRQLNIGFRGRVPGMDLKSDLAPVERGARRFAPAHEVLWLTANDGPDPATACAGLEQQMNKISK
jgi:uncharacterized iron-regulated protein